MRIVNSGQAKSLLPTAWAAYLDTDPPKPPDAGSIPPGATWAVSDSTTYCWVFHETYPKGAPQVAFWKGRVHPEESLVVNPDTEEVSSGSQVLQSNVGGKLCAQITHGPTFTYYLGNRAALGTRLEMLVAPSTPYLIFEVRPVPGDAFGLTSGITVTGPGLTVNRPINDGHVVAYDDGHGHLESVLVMAPAPGVWTASINPGGPENEDYVLLGIAGPDHASYQGIEDGIAAATPVAMDVIDDLVTGEDGRSIRSHGLSIRSPGVSAERSRSTDVCVTCMIAVIVPMSLVSGYAATALAAAGVTSEVVLGLVALTGFPALALKEVVNELGVELNPAKWPKIFCQKMGFCS